MSKSEVKIVDDDQESCHMSILIRYVTANEIINN